jgi:hypothetical protein
MKRHVLLAAAVVAAAAVHPFVASATPQVKGVLRSHGVLATAAQSIGSSGPLTSIGLGEDLSCQVGYNGSNQIFYSSYNPADCGTFLGVGGTLYAPNFAAHAGTATYSLGAYTAFTPVSQTASWGDGSVDDPYTVTTVVDAGTTGLRITQVDSYVTGRQYFRSDIVVTNNGSAPATAMLSRAADCYFEGSDSGTGVGLYNTASHTAMAGCVSPGTARSMRLISQTPGNKSGLNTFSADTYNQIWSKVGATRTGTTPLPNNVHSGTFDNGMAVAWQIKNLPVKGSVIKTVLHEFVNPPIRWNTDLTPVYCNADLGDLPSTSPQPTFDCVANPTPTGGVRPARVACAAAIATAASSDTRAASAPAIAACALAVSGIANCTVVTGTPPVVACAPGVTRARPARR